MTNFTPGPWKVETKCACLGVFDSKGHGVANIVYGRPDDELNANARLIAAAPEMYAMLKEFEDIFTESGKTGFAAHIKLLLMRIDGEEEAK